MLFDVIGMLGVVMILTTYALVPLDRINVKGITYSLANAMGAGLILISLTVDFNLSAVVIESCWLLISTVGIYSSLKKDSGGPESTSIKALTPKKTVNKS